MKRTQLALILTLTLSIAAVASCSSESRGREIFTSELCPACHYFRGIGREGGIDLSNVGQRRSKVWIREHIENPRRHDPNIGMPSFGHLSGPELDSLVKFLTSSDSG